MYIMYAYSLRINLGWPNSLIISTRERKQLPAKSVLTGNVNSLKHLLILKFICFHSQYNKF